MIYKFRSKAAGDLIMLGAHGDAMLRLIGKEPAAAGIIEPAALQSALLALREAVAGADAPVNGEAVSLRQRLWPMVEMMKRAAQADEAIVWGV